MDITMLPRFAGNVIVPGDPRYDSVNNLYATSTYGEERKMKPAAILQPINIEDIQQVVRLASGLTGSPRTIAIRTGGHQYSGASSTDSSGIQLDLKGTFRRRNIDLALERDTVNGKVCLRSSVSWELKEIFAFLQENGVFMPTGVCSTVCLGGHVQTGGYGMLTRSFGLLGDYVRELEIVDYNGDVVNVTRDNNPELFYGLLGGSPGNLGVLTHVKIEVQEDKKHQNSKGLWIAFHYRPDTLKGLLDLLVEKVEDPKFPRGYDFTVNIVSQGNNLLDLYPGSEEELRLKLPDNIHDGKDNIADPRNFQHALIIVYAQWVNVGEEAYSHGFFNKIKTFPDRLAVKETLDGTPMSAIAPMWFLKGDREFRYPYIKRANSTKSVALSTNGWSAWFCDRVKRAIESQNKGIYLSSQLQVYGGEKSMFHRNVKYGGNGTSYCFRDATFVGTWDIFYDDARKGAKEAAEKWQETTDVGARKHLSEEDRRVLWGSYGDWDMKKVWRFYYDEKTYKTMREIRKKYDPNGTFTANPFCVEALE